MTEKNVAALVESHAWTAGAAVLEPGQLQQWAGERLARIQARLDKLEGGIGSAEQTWRAYDDAVAELSQVASECGLLDSVYPDKAVRDKAQTLAQKVSEVATALSLNQQIYRALAAADLKDADDATRHYSERTLLQYRLAGVDRDDATRARLKELQEKATLLALTISRNVQEGANHVLVDDASELQGLPEDYLASHLPAAEGENAGRIVLTTDFPITFRS